jgi:hypothetical protein
MAISFRDAQGFDRDEGNRSKSQQHGLSVDDLERVFAGTIMLLPDQAHSTEEVRHKAIGEVSGRKVFVVFTLREREGRVLLRPISARYMHRKEVKHYEEENPGLQNR